VPGGISADEVKLVGTSAVEADKDGEEETVDVGGGTVVTI
jgi:hypothetical protein